MSDDSKPSSTPRAVGNGIRARGARSECAACGAVVAGVGPFDAHRVGAHGVDRRCVPVADLAASFRVDLRGYWTAR